MPAQLFELAFIDEPKTDVFVLKERCNEMAEVLAKGILTHLGVQDHATINSPISSPSDKPAIHSSENTVTIEIFGQLMNTLWVLPQRDNMGSGKASF